MSEISYEDSNMNILIYYKPGFYKTHETISDVFHMSFYNNILTLNRDDGYIDIDLKNVNSFRIYVDDMY